MIQFIKCFLISVSVFLCACANSQSKKYTTENAHSHNDYLNTTPFYVAFREGFGSIEADIFPVNGILFVAHHKEEIQTQRTLNNLYITPLLQQFISNKKRKLSLLIDIKENYELALPMLIKELQPLQKYLSTQKKPKYFFFDADLQLPHNAEEWKRVALVSLPFNKLSGWKGSGFLINEDKEKITQVIDSAHSKGKPIRFWAAPDTRDSWRLQMEMHVDLIGTDKIAELSTFLTREIKR
jgi:alkaline phosphatase